MKAIAAAAVVAASLSLALPALAQSAPIVVVAGDGPTDATRDAIAAAAAAGQPELTVQLVGLQDIADPELVALIEGEIIDTAAARGFAADKVHIVRCQELTCR